MGLTPFFLARFAVTWPVIGLVKNINIPINTNFAVINEKPLCKIIPNIINEASRINHASAWILEKTSGNLIRPKDPVKIKKTPTIKDIMDIISIDISNMLFIPKGAFIKKF